MFRAWKQKIMPSQGKNVFSSQILHYCHYTLGSVFQVTYVSKQQHRLDMSHHWTGMNFAITELV